MKPAQDKTALGYTLLGQPVRPNPAHVRTVVERVEREPDADTLLDILGIRECAQ